ncbi:GbsR/MarR family transcriptional regulator [Coraliomargarita parva]|uniref:GbsR/MarR family transcriptional regulator n=1 Tax=Coraliomargarita parva TaxID=3014050 RepID=UPI0022B2F59C|nr:hypothetical protein [Coraliomargarita parva]
MASETAQSSSSAPALSAWETAMIEVFVRAAGLIGLPRSVGEIYGCLYCATEALTFDGLCDRLDISRGSVSQGLKLLRQLGAVNLHYVPGSRKDHYVPELSMKRLVRGFLRDQFAPHLESGEDRLDQIEDLIGSDVDPARRSHAQKRLQTLRTWKDRTRKLMPVVLSVLGGASFLEDDAGEVV